MNVNVYLPDALGEQAKASDLPLSRMLRDAVETELQRRSAVETTLAGKQDTYEVDLETKDGVAFRGRITGTVLDPGSGTVFLTSDERVIVYDEKRCAIHELQDPEEDLRDWLSGDEYIAALAALGITAVVDV